MEAGLETRRQEIPLRRWFWCSSRTSEKGGVPVILRHLSNADLIEVNLCICHGAGIALTGKQVSKSARAADRSARHEGNSTLTKSLQ